MDSDKLRKAKEEGWRESISFAFMDTAIATAQEQMPWMTPGEIVVAVDGLFEKIANSSHQARAIAEASEELYECRTL